MPYTPSGYVLPAVYLAIPGTTIIAAQHNIPLVDLQDANNYARPVANGGTGAATAGGARTNLAVPGLADVNVFTARNSWSKGADIVSATVLPIGADGNYFHVTGGNTITSFSAISGAGPIYLEFDAALTLTHSAALILPGAADYTTAAGDVLQFVQESSGNYRCTAAQRQANHPATSTEFAASGTWTQPAGCVAVQVLGSGGGGGGGGVNGNASGGGGSGGGGGGACGWSTIIDVSAIASATITIGTGGAGGAAGANDGAAGGNTIWADGTHTLTWSGGGAGTGAAGSTTPQSRPGGLGGVGTSVKAGGGYGMSGIGGAASAEGGNGGTGVSRGGNGAFRTSGGATAGTSAAANSGGGGGGGAVFNSASNVAGGNGGSGYMMVVEYY